MNINLNEKELELIKKSLIASSVELLSGSKDRKLIKRMGKEWAIKTEKQSKEMMELVNKLRRGINEK